jgi:hypothetical protein
MADVTYVVVEHDGGWAYKLGDAYSESFATHDDALAAAKLAAARQQRESEPEEILYQDENGRWHREHVEGDQKPHPDVIG